MNNTFVIVTWNNEREIGPLLDSITKFEPRSAVIVVDNASTDQTIQRLNERQDSSLQVLAQSQNLGFARANNLAIRQVTTCYVTLLNPDTRLTAPLVRDLENELSDRIRMIGVKLVNLDGSRQPTMFRFQNPGTILIEQFALGKFMPEWLRTRWSPERSRHDHSQLTDWVIGAFMFTRTVDLRAVGGLSEDYFLYAEDMDLCYKYRQRGWSTLFDPTHQVLHAGGRSENQTGTGKNLKLLRSFCRFAVKYGLRGNVRALYFAYRIKAVLFRGQPERARRYRENVEYLRGKLK